MGTLKITLRSDLCPGNGEAFGNSIDSDICFNPEGIPFIPARRIKGCLKAAAVELNAMEPDFAPMEQIDELFGSQTGKEGKLHVSNAFPDNMESLRYSLRKLRENKEISEYISNEDIRSAFAYIRGSTRLEDGVAQKETLRYFRVLSHYPAYKNDQPLAFYAEISMDNDSDELNTLLENCAKAFRHLGTKRNRGLGIVQCIYSAGKSLQNVSLPEAGKETTQRRIRLSYQIRLDAPVTLPGCKEQLSSIPARSVIGLLAGQYLRRKEPGTDEFRALFLDGRVRWSALTPVIRGRVSQPVPLMLAYLKHNDQYVNRYCREQSWRDQKIRTLEGKYAAPASDGWNIASVLSDEVYHHRHTEKMLYTQEAINAGMIYGGCVETDEQYADLIQSLLSDADFRFGRSKSAQYASCTLLTDKDRCIRREDIRKNPIAVNKGQCLYVVLESDAYISENGIIRQDDETVREMITRQLGIRVSNAEEDNDYCEYHVISGYQTKWQLQKPQIPVIRGGSVFSFAAEETGTIQDRTFWIGENHQEGFGRCRAYTQEEMNRLSHVQEYPADLYANPDPVQTATEEPALYHYLIVREAQKRMARRGLDYGLAHEGEISETNLNSRLRMILEQANSFLHFAKMIESIKDSDKLKSARKTVRELYGFDTAVLQSDSLPASETVQPDLKTMLSTTGDDTLLSVIETDKLQDRTREHWKIILSKALRKEEYQKRGDKQ